MAKKLVVSATGARMVDLSDEDLAQRAIDEAKAAEDAAAEASEKERLDDIKAQEFVAKWEGRFRGKTSSEIVNAFSKATAADKSELLLAMTLRWALEIR